MSFRRTHLAVGARGIRIEAHQQQSDFVAHPGADGEPLSRRLARGALTPQEAFRYAIEIGSGLGLLHDRGIVHGRLCPECVMIGCAGVRILRTPVDPAETAPYRAPEQARGEATDTRTDIFAFGTILYELATGRRAFEGTGDELSRRILEEAPTGSESSPAYAAMKCVISACLEKRPAARRQRIQNAVADLKLARLCWLTMAARVGRTNLAASHTLPTVRDRQDWIVRIWLIAVTVVAAMVTLLAVSMLLSLGSR